MKKLRVLVSFILALTMVMSAVGTVGADDAAVYNDAVSIENQVVTTEGSASYAMGKYTTGTHTLEGSLKIEETTSDASHSNEALYISDYAGTNNGTVAIITGSVSHSKDIDNGHARGINAKIEGNGKADIRIGEDIEASSNGNGYQVASGVEMTTSGQATAAVTAGGSVNAEATGTSTASATGIELKVTGGETFFTVGDNVTATATIDSDNYKENAAIATAIQASAKDGGEATVVVENDAVANSDYSAYAIKIDADGGSATVDVGGKAVAESSKDPLYYPDKERSIYANVKNEGSADITIGKGTEGGMEISTQGKSTTTLTVKKGGVVLGDGQSSMHVYADGQSYAEVKIEDGGITSNGQEHPVNFTAKDESVMDVTIAGGLSSEGDETAVEASNYDSSMTLTVKDGMTVNGNAISAFAFVGDEGTSAKTDILVVGDVESESTKSLGLQGIIDVRADGKGADADLDVQGNITAKNNGQSAGLALEGEDGGIVTAEMKGNISVESGSFARGLEIDSDSNASIQAALTGNIEAKSAWGTRGVSIEGDDHSDIQAEVTGNVKSEGDTSAYGLVVYASDDSSIKAVTGTITTEAKDTDNGFAIGVEILNGSGSVDATVNGDINASGAEGIGALVNAERDYKIDAVNARIGQKTDSSPKGIKWEYSSIQGEDGMYMLCSRGSGSTKEFFAYGPLRYGLYTEDFTSYAPISNDSILSDFISSGSIPSDSISSDVIPNAPISYNPGLNGSADSQGEMAYYSVSGITVEYAEAENNTNLKVYGDVTGDTVGVALSADEGSVASILVDGTVTGEEAGLVLLGDTKLSDNVTMTVWKLEGKAYHGESNQGGNNAGGYAMADYYGGAYGVEAAPAAEEGQKKQIELGDELGYDEYEKIQYIIKIEEGSKDYITTDGTKSVEQDGETYKVATETDTVTVKLNLPSNMRINALYWNGSELKGKDYITGEGNTWYLKVPRGGGVMLAVDVTEMCTVSFNANGGTGTMASVTVEKGTEYTLPANGFTAPEGYEFDKWDKGAAGDKIKIDADTEIKALWKKQTCTVSFDANGGTGTMASVTVEKGSEYTLPACGFTAPEGKEFDSWDKGAAGTKIKIDADTVVKAQWKEIPKETCTVSFDANGGTGTMASVTVGKGSEYTLPANGFTAPEGKIFDSWDKGAVGDKIKIDADTVVKAQWKEIPKETCTVSFDANGGTGTMASVTVEKGSEYILPANGFTAPQGSSFAGWDKGAAGDKIRIDADTVIKAQWAAAPTPQPYNTYVLTIDPNGGEVDGHTEIYKLSIVEDRNYKLPTPDEREGYKLIGWYVGEFGQEDERWVDPEEDDVNIRKAGDSLKVDQPWTLTAIWKTSK